MLEVTDSVRYIVCLIENVVAAALDVDVAEMDEEDLHSDALSSTQVPFEAGSVTTTL